MSVGRHQFDTSNRASREQLRQLEIVGVEFAAAEFTVLMCLDGIAVRAEQRISASPEVRENASVVGRAALEFSMPSTVAKPVVYLQRPWIIEIAQRATAAKSPNDLESDFTATGCGIHRQTLSCTVSSR